MTTTNGLAPHGVRWNAEAEECVIGIAMRNRDAIPALVADLTANDFYRPANAAAFAAIVELHQSGTAVDELTVSDVLRRQGQLEIVGGQAELIRLANDIPSTLHGQHYASIVRREAAARALQRILAEGQRALADQDDPAEVQDVVLDQAATIDRGGQLPERYWANADDYLDIDHTEVTDPLIPGACYKRSRIMLVARQKSGKSTVSREFAYLAAAGIHPFTFKRIPPVRVLILDAENDDPELVPAMTTVRDLLRLQFPDTPRPALVSYPWGLDLQTRRHRSEVEAAFEHFRPELVVGGPIYKFMHKRDREDWDPFIERLRYVFENWQERWGMALMIEHHAKTKTSGEDSLQGKGGEQWESWANLTVALRARTSEDGIRHLDVERPYLARGHFRWPKRFDWGIRAGQWPWEPCMESGEVEPVPEEPPGIFGEGTF